MTAPMEKLLKKDTKFKWTKDFQESLNKTTTMPILMFLDSKKEFHVHLNASSVALGVVMPQPGEGSIDNLISFASRKLSLVEKNYTTTERKGLEMVYALHKFIHYLLGGHFKMYTDHSALKYLVNKLVLGGGISVGGFSSSRYLILR